MKNVKKFKDFMNGKLNESSDSTQTIQELMTLFNLSEEQAKYITDIIDDELLPLDFDDQMDFIDSLDLGDIIDDDDISYDIIEHIKDTYI